MKPPDLSIAKAGTATPIATVMASALQLERWIAITRISLSKIVIEMLD